MDRSRPSGSPIIAAPSASTSDALTAALEPGEAVVWQGTPEPTLYARRGWPVPCALVGGGSIVFGVVNLVSYAVWRADPNAGAEGLGRVVVVVGLVVCVASTLVGGLLLTTPLWQGRRAGHVVYAITDRRLLVVETWRWRPPWVPRVRSLWPREVDVPREVFEVGGSDLFFGLPADVERRAAELAASLLWAGEADEAPN